MRYLNDQQPPYDLTYSDVFLVPSFTELDSRFEVDLTPTDGSGATLPIVIANMNAVAGRRMSEVVARRGGLAVLPQDIPADVLQQMIRTIKACDTLYETPLVLTAKNTINDALNIIHKRAHDAVVIVDDKKMPIGIFTQADADGHDRFTTLANVMTPKPVTVAYNLKPQKIFELLHKNRVSVAPVVKNKKLVGVVTQKGALRSEIYKPALDKRGRLMGAAAVGINGNVSAKVESLLKLGVDVIVLDTAHGYQAKMIRAIKAARSINKKGLIVAGNVATAEATKALLEAGADIAKVGIGPGAMCTTRMMTGVGRPQFSAVAECALAARELGKAIWADGGIRYPRDVALALAAGASNVMWGSMWAGTFESPGDVLFDSDGRMYKENFGMASRRAVKDRTRDQDLFSQIKKEFFEEGISSSKYFLDPARPAAEDVIDYVTAGVRSALSYMGARNLDEFYVRAVVGVQTMAGYQEGQSLDSSWF